MPSPRQATVAGPFSVPFSAAAWVAPALPVRAATGPAVAALQGMPPAVQDHVHSLGQHLRQCHQAQGRFFGLGRWGHELHGLVAPRFVTTLAGAGVLIALACLV